jgi:hypothetical protein
MSFSQPAFGGTSASRHAARSRYLLHALTLTLHPGRLPRRCGAVVWHGLRRGACLWHGRRRAVFWHGGRRAVFWHGGRRAVFWHGGSHDP